jgi:hypothetical protein
VSTLVTPAPRVTIPVNQSAVPRVLTVVEPVTWSVTVIVLLISVVGVKVNAFVPDAEPLVVDAFALSHVAVAVFVPP